MTDDASHIVCPSPHLKALRCQESVAYRTTISFCGGIDSLSVTIPDPEHSVDEERFLLIKTQ